MITLIPSAFALSGSFTIEAWIYPTAAWGSENTIFFVNTTGGVFFGNRPTGFGLRRVGTTDVLLTTPPAINTWTHVAITRDSSNNIRVFFNGTAQALNGGAGTTITSTQNFLSTAQMQLGLWSGTYFNGYMDRSEEDTSELQSH